LLIKSPQMNADAIVLHHLREFLLDIESRPTRKQRIYEPKVDGLMPPEVMCFRIEERTYIPVVLGSAVTGERWQ